MCDWFLYDIVIKLISCMSVLIEKWFKMVCCLDWMGKILLYVVNY